MLFKIHKIIISIVVNGRTPSLEIGSCFLSKTAQRNWHRIWAINLQEIHLLREVMKWHQMKRHFNLSPLYCYSWWQEVLLLRHCVFGELLFLDKGIPTLYYRIQQWKLCENCTDSGWFMVKNKFKNTHKNGTMNPHSVVYKLIIFFLVNIDTAPNVKKNWWSWDFKAVISTKVHSRHVGNSPEVVQGTEEINWHEIQWRRRTIEDWL